MPAWTFKSSATFLAVALLFTATSLAEGPSAFSFTPKFKDPVPGTRFWSRGAGVYIEKLPNGKENHFKIWKEPTRVQEINGLVVEKIDEPGFYVFIADIKAKRQELWWWRGKGPWMFLGAMVNAKPQSTF